MTEEMGIPTRPDARAGDPGSQRLAGSPVQSLMKCVFSVDVEDWFHILDVPEAPTPSQWDALPSHIEKNFLKLLEIFDEHRARVTCFFLGWVSQKFPHLVKEAARRGHEIASHGLTHRLVYRMTPQEFCEDALASRRILEDIAGQPILGYRSAGFSVVEETPWFAEKLIDAGYVYDSSVFPAPRSHGGLKNGHYLPHVVSSASGKLVEFPITVTDIFGWRFCFSGGGYLRLFPYFLVKRWTSKVLNEGNPVVFYVHPREIDPGHPRLPMHMIRKFQSYVNLKTTEPKIRRLLTEFEVTNFQNFLSDAGNLPALGWTPGGAPIAPDVVREA